MSVKINNRAIIHTGKVFSLIRESVTLDNGVTTDLEFIEHPGAAAIVPLLNPERMILLRQYRHALRGYVWEVPAGTLDPQESVISCASRELVEETGYSAGRWQKLGKITPVPGYSNERIHIFLAADLTPIQGHLDEDEVIEVHAVKVQEALAMIATGKIQDAKSIAGIFLAVNWLEQNKTCL